MAALTDEQLIDVFDRQLPDLLRRRPDLEPRVFKSFLTAFARRREDRGVACRDAPGLRGDACRLDPRHRPVGVALGHPKPARMILATASIHSRRAHELRRAGIEVVEPEEDPD